MNFASSTKITPPEFISETISIEARLFLTVMPLKITLSHVVLALTCFFSCFDPVLIKIVNCPFSLPVFFTETENSYFPLEIYSMFCFTVE